MGIKEIKEFCRKYKVAILILFLLDLIIPDPIPFLDEIILGVLTVFGFAAGEDRHIRNLTKLNSKSKIRK